MAESRHAPREPSAALPASETLPRAPSTTSRPPAPTSSIPASRSSASPPARLADDVLVAFPAPRGEVTPATLFRSTWIVSSLQSLRERGHFARYEAHLGGKCPEILECVAGMWLSMDTAKAHYEACDALGLALEEQIAMGRAVGGRAQGTILQTTVKAARGAGVTPWTILPHFERLWRRGANGGGICVTKTGPKEARVELVGCALFDIAYFRNGFRGVLLGIGDMFCRTPYAHDLGRRTPGEAAFQLQWV